IERLKKQKRVIKTQTSKLYTKLLRLMSNEKCEMAMITKPMKRSPDLFQQLWTRQIQAQLEDLRNTTPFQDDDVQEIEKFCGQFETREATTCQANGQKIRVNAVLDDASSASYISEEVAGVLGLSAPYEPVTVQVLNENIETFDTMPVDLILENSDGYSRSAGCVLKKIPIASKTQVTPLMPVSIPRLELLAAVLGLSMNPNRVGFIQSQTNLEQWQYIGTKDNPADMCSRGSKAAQLIDSVLWWRGSQFLQKTELEWQLKKIQSFPEEVKEAQLYTICDAQKKRFKEYEVIKNGKILPIRSSFSSHITSG
ncbi:Hypothetical predicted protein, partial [Paramuricea clavata]